MTSHTSMATSWETRGMLIPSPIPKINIFKELRLGNGISPSFLILLRGGVWPVIPKSFLFFGENVLLVRRLFHHANIQVGASIALIACYLSCYKVDLIWAMNSQTLAQSWSNTPFYQTKIFCRILYVILPLHNGWLILSLQLWCMCYLNPIVQSNK